MKQGKVSVSSIHAALHENLISFPLKSRAS